MGLHFGHDCAIAIINEGRLEFYAHMERYTRVKHDSIYLTALPKLFPNLPPLSKDDFLVMVSIGGKNATKEYFNNFWANLHNTSQESFGYDPRLVRGFNPIEPNNFVFEMLGRQPNVVINHHLAHALTAWAYRADDRSRVFLAYDGAGCDGEGYPQSSLVGEVGPQGIKAYFDAEVIPSSIPVSELLGNSTAGKAMGLAGYITPKKKWSEGDLARKILQYTLGPPLYNPRFLQLNDLQNISQEDLEFVAEFYRWYTQQVMWPAIEANVIKYAQDRPLMIGGGSTLALELNTRIYELNQDVTFAPPTDDSGLAIGAALFAYFFHSGRWINLRTPAINALPVGLPRVGPQSPKEIANAIASGETVGLLRKQAEAGPRALGFRSLLASAGDYDNLIKVSQTIKGREWYRPLAPMVLDEEFDRFFEGPQGTMMQYRVQCRQDSMNLIPAVVHTDGSSRPQVVDESDPWLYELLKEYKKLTGVGCIINTSLNGKGKPICNTYEDAREDFLNLPVVISALPYRAWGQRVVLV